VKQYWKKNYWRNDILDKKKWGMLPGWTDKIFIVVQERFFVICHDHLNMKGTIPGY